MEEKENTFYAENEEAWRDWLAANHTIANSVWLIIYKKGSGQPSVYYPEAVDQALCFGWVDSKPNKRDDQSFYQFFSPRNPTSNWSRVNKEKVERLIKTGQMTEAGMALINKARESGAWTALDDVENLVIPSDLQEALEQVPNALDYFQAFPKSARRGILEWILNAKRAETRAKRVTETAKLAGENIRANQWPRK
ncbi:MAG: YdeI/OmpD-associated family protein [Bacteroidota bacterium]